MLGFTTEKSCLDKLRGLRDDREKLSRRAWELDQERQRLDAESNETVLQVLLGDDAAISAAEARDVRLQAIARQLRGVPAARKVLAGQFHETLVELGKLRAKATRSQAKKLQGDLDTLVRERDKRLAALAELEGVQFIPDFRPVDAMGRPATALVMSSGREILDGDALARGLPKSAQMAVEIARLSTQADEIEARALRATKGAQLAAENLEALLLVCDDVETLAPVPAEIHAWFEQADQQAENDFLNRHPGGLFYSNSGRSEPVRRITTFSIRWDEDGALDWASSAWSNRFVNARAAA